MNFYEGDVRAALASSEDALVQSDTHKTNSIDSIALTNRKSSTFFDIHLGKGDEIADFSYNYGGDGTTVRTVSVNYYQGDVRAALASSEDALVQSDTHKTTSIDTIALTNRKSSTFFDIHLG